ncbi:Rpr2-domain-containing protein [Gonapodya prolifera JEL478]|uniref:Rpr2-domain-containing protein n=1 Tax=Gonapodya prolifera (strain JEL478) TaxID=1344416 RepID=A0A139AX87_GONPJ|nr:Rpr2-domain-containing protein [Gonapodya prolifera JEL478]|eukprot:KXS21356.1 Rpr2-domain-containing protein [Gonapodya prolifera JEL478]
MPRTSGAAKPLKVPSADAYMRMNYLAQIAAWASTVTIPTLTAPLPPPPAPTPTPNTPTHPSSAPRPQTRKRKGPGKTRRPPRIRAFVPRNPHANQSPSSSSSPSSSNPTTTTTAAAATPTPTPTTRPPGDPLHATLAGLGSFYLSTMKTITERLVLRIDPSLKRMTCKRCGVLLVPATTASVSVGTHTSSPHPHITTTCRRCLTPRRLVIAPDHALWAEDGPVVEHGGGGGRGGGGGGGGGGCDE